MLASNVAAPGRHGSSIGTRHRLEALSQLLEGKTLSDKDYEAHTIEDMLAVFATTRNGFDFLNSPESKKVTIWPTDKIDPVKHALHFERIFEGNERAERIVRALAKALEEYQKATAAYDTPKFVFDSPEVEEEAREAVRGLAEMAWHLPVFPRDDGFEKFFN